MLTLNDTAIINNVTAFMEEIERNPSVEGTALSTTAPGRFYGKQVMTAETNDGEMGEKAFNNCFVSYDYMDVMGLTLVKGRFYDRVFGSDFTYRIDFPFWTFIISLLLSLTIAVITVSWQSLKASRMNPAASIRVE